MKNTLVYVIGALLLIGGVVLYMSLNGSTDIEEPTDLLSEETLVDEESVIDGHKHARYRMPDGTSVTLSDGIAETFVEEDESIPPIVTRHFGDELFKDLSGDGRDDVVFLLTQDAGGSGTFFYVVAALNTDEGFYGSQALLLGDRITPQSIESGPGTQVIVNYVDRAPDEPMTATPSVEVSLHLVLNTSTMQFEEVSPEFAEEEAEADQAGMTLEMKTWIWEKTEYTDGRVVTPSTPDEFTLAFSREGSVSVGTDCNSAGGSYTAENGSLTFSELFSTLMYCEGSVDSEFIASLDSVDGYAFTPEGMLHLLLKDDEGTVVLR